MKQVCAGLLFSLLFLVNPVRADVTALRELKQAFQDKDVVAANRILGGNIDVEMEMRGWPLLVVAANHSRADLVRDLLAGGTAVDATNTRGDSAVILAAYNNAPEIVELLARHGADLDLRGQDGATALLWAARKGHTEVAASLLRHGANPDVAIRPHGLTQSGSFPGRPGATALIIAVERGHGDIARLLVDAGADLDATDTSCTSAIQAARMYERPALFDLLQRRGASPTPECRGAAVESAAHIGLAVALAILLLLETRNGEVGRAWRIVGHLLNTGFLAAAVTLVFPAFLYEPIYTAAPAWGALLVALANLAALAWHRQASLVRAMLGVNTVLSYVTLAVFALAIANDFASANPMVGVTLIFGLVMFLAIRLAIRALRAQLDTPPSSGPG